MDRTGLADFLRRRREGLRPADVGLSPGARRRTPGLRREEVAALAALSVDYYGRLEQARGPHPSVQALTSLARALRLSDDERDHLFRLAGHEAPSRRAGTRHVRPGVLLVLDRLADAAAFVVSDLGETLVQNELARLCWATPRSTAGERRTTSGAGSPIRPPGRSTPSPSTTSTAGPASRICGPPPAATRRRRRRGAGRGAGAHEPGVHRAVEPARGRRPAC
jgi:transcriptional regulator with XRE-family HTH domain